MESPVRAPLRANCIDPETGTKRPFQDDSFRGGDHEIDLHSWKVHSSLTCTIRTRNTSLMREPKTYFVYIMTNRSKTLYTGITNSLVRRVREHKSGIGSSFTCKYRIDRLVYFERFEDVRNAIEREKEIKSWHRIRKIALIVAVNPAWKDLSLEWLGKNPFAPDANAVARREAARLSS